MMLFASWIKHPFDVAVQCLHDANPREHRRPVGLPDQDQGFHRCLPFLGFMLGLRKLRDVVAGILQGAQLAAAGQRYRFVETSGPGH
jgi:hypothetical protein